LESEPPTPVLAISEMKLVIKKNFRKLIFKTKSKMVRKIKKISNIAKSFVSKKRVKDQILKNFPTSGKCELTKMIIDGYGNINGFQCNCGVGGHPVQKKDAGKKIYYTIDYTKKMRIV
jgi:hypothetical protein